MCKELRESVYVTLSFYYSIVVPVSSIMYFKSLQCFPLDFSPSATAFKNLCKVVLSGNSKSGRSPNSAVELLWCDLKEGQSYNCNTMGIL
jgi:hypothetical protein